MAEIDGKLGNGGMGRGITEESGVATIKTLFDGLVDDIAAFAAKYDLMLAALDAQSGFSGYVSTYAAPTESVTKAT